MQNNNRPFRPSIKFDPLIKINKQNDVKIMLKVEFCSKLSIKVSLEETISRSNKITEKKTRVN